MDIIKLCGDRSLIGLEKRTLSLADTDKLMTLFKLETLGPDFFKESNRPNILEIADPVRSLFHTVSFDTFTRPTGDDLNQFIITQANSMRQFKIARQKFVSFINGPDLWTGTDRGGQCRINICYFDFSLEKVNGWVYSANRVVVNTYIQYIYVSPMFITVNELYN